MADVPDLLAQAAAHRKSGQLEEARQCYARAAAIDSNCLAAYQGLAVVLERLQQFDEALVNLRQAASLRPNSSEFAEGIARVTAKLEFQASAALAASGKADEAIERLRRALQLRPDFFEAHLNLGALLAAQSRILEAVACFQRATELRPDAAEAWLNLAAALETQARLADAVVCYQRALSIAPDHWQAHVSLAAALVRQGKLTDAVIHCRQAIAQNPHNPLAYNCLGVIATRNERLDEAGVLFRRALELEPESADAALNLSAVLSDQGRNVEARECLQQAAASHPREDIWRLAAASLCPITLDSQDEIDAFYAHLRAALDGLRGQELNLPLGPLVSSSCRPSHEMLYHGQDDRDIRQVYARLLRPHVPKREPRGSGGRRRIGFLVTDGHEGIFTRHMGRVLERIEASALELVLVGSPRGISKMTAAIDSAAIRSLPLPDVFPLAIDVLEAARFDILCHWEVATDQWNYLLPFCRLAPLQCMLWGTPSTSGIAEMDVYLSSALIESAGAKGHYCEELVLLRTLPSFQQRAPAPIPKTPEFFGLGPAANFYVCAQHLRKFHPDFDSIVAGILRADPRGVLVVNESRRGRFISQRLRNRFGRAIPDVSERIVILPYQTHENYWSLLGAADVLLDTVHYGGMTTAYDGLSLDKPIVTLPSEFHRGRCTLGCYRKMGLDDCVVATPQEYIDLCVALGTDAGFRGTITAKIRETSGALFDDLQVVHEYQRVLDQLLSSARG